MQNLIIYLAVLLIIILIIMLANFYKKVNKLTDSFNQKVKELDAKDNTINSQKAELANRKDEIEKKKKEIQKLNDDLELFKSQIESKEEDIERLRINNKELTERYHDNRRRLDNDIVDLTELKESLQQKITTLEEENQQLLT